MTVLRSFELPMLRAASPRLLVVEDDPVLACAVTSLLEDRYRLSLAATGEEALNFLQRQGDVDLVLLDYRLPGISGLDVLHRIKELRPSLPVIFVTAYGSEDVAVRAFTTGARDYIRKPFTYADLIAKIEFCLSLNPAGERDRPARTFVRPPCVPAPDRAPSHQNFHKIQKAVKYIEDNFSSAVTLDAAAGRACISPCHFSRVFKAVMGVPFKQYLVGLRIEKAKEILRQGDRTVSEIGDAVGYDEPAHFVKIFKKRTGCTPSEYRRSQAAPDPGPASS